MLRRVYKKWKAPPRLTISEWADQERRLSPENSAEPGRWHTSRAEYQRGIMDSITDIHTRTVVAMKANQVGWTEVIGNVVGYFMEHDPCPILVVQPTLEAAEGWSKERLALMIRDTPALRDKVNDPRSRDSGNTVRSKEYPGGRISIVGANSASGLASRPIRFVLADEVDKYDVSAGTEGDPLTLASKRQQTFWNARTLMGSTPGLKITSRIWREWERSDQRKFFVPCPTCGSRQTIRWENVRWDRGDAREHLAHTAHYVCEGSGCVWTDVDRWRAVSSGEWRATAKGEPGIVGFHVPAFISPWVTLESVVREFLAVRKDPWRLQVWVNTVLAEPWEEAAEKVDATSLYSRGENYGPESLPDAVQLATAGVDVHGDRLEVQVIGWGYREESWVAQYEIIWGDPSQVLVWDQLDAILLQKLRTVSGREVRVRAACVDSGGHHGAEVFAYCNKRKGRRVFPIKGIAGSRPIWPKRSSRTGRNKEQVFLIGVDTGKDAIYGRLRGIGKPGPGYVHFPVGDGFDAKYFDQLTSERVVTRKRMGHPYRVWELPAGRRNEVLDTFNYALAARLSTGLKLDTPPAPEGFRPPRVDAPPAPPPIPGGTIVKALVAAKHVAARKSIAKMLAR
jgi:phage terminase large subunit GpA-like protein